MVQQYQSMHEERMKQGAFDADQRAADKAALEKVVYVVHASDSVKSITAVTRLSKHGMAIAVSV
jgi:hypothetical protein